MAADLNFTAVSKAWMSKRNLNYSTYLYIIYALVFLATHYTVSTLDENAFRGKSTLALEGEYDAQFKLS